MQTTWNANTALSLYGLLTAAVAVDATITLIGALLLVKFVIIPNVWLAAMKRTDKNMKISIQIKLSSHTRQKILVDV